MDGRALTFTHPPIPGLWLRLDCVFCLHRIALALRCLQTVAFACILSAFILQLDNNQVRRPEDGRGGGKRPSLPSRREREGRIAQRTREGRIAQRTRWAGANVPASRRAEDERGTSRRGREGRGANVAASHCASLLPTRLRPNPPSARATPQLTHQALTAPRCHSRRCKTATGCCTSRPCAAASSACSRPSRCVRGVGCPRLSVSPPQSQPQHPTHRCLVCPPVCRLRPSVPPPHHLIQRWLDCPRPSAAFAHHHPIQRWLDCPRPSAAFAHHHPPQCWLDCLPVCHVTQPHLSRSPVLI